MSDNNFNQYHVILVVMKGTGSKEIPATKFKKDFFRILDNLSPEGLTITQYGRPIAVILPVTHEFKRFIGMLEGQVNITGDIYSTGLSWDMETSEF